MMQTAPGCASCSSSSSCGREVGQRTQQQHRQHQARQVERVEHQGRREEDVAQQHRHTHRYGTPVVELLRGDAVFEEVHSYHHQTCYVEHVEYQLGPRLA